MANICSRCEGQEQLPYSRRNGWNPSTARSKEAPSSPGFQDSHKLASRPLAIEPVRSLRHGNKIRSCPAELCFCSAATLVISEMLPTNAACLAHFGVGLERRNFIPVLQQHSGPSPVRKQCRRPHVPASVRTRVSSFATLPEDIPPIPDIILDTIGKIAVGWRQDRMRRGKIYRLARKPF